MEKPQSPISPAEDYDLEPVCYCPRCYSLRIGRIEGVEGADYCMDCGCPETSEATIGEWERLYSGRYGRRLVERKRSPQEARIAGMTTRELRAELCGRPDFPKGLPMPDSALVLSDMVARDGREKELRKLLIETL